MLLSFESRKEQHIHGSTVGGIFYHPYNFCIMCSVNLWTAIVLNGENTCQVPSENF